MVDLSTKKATIKTAKYLTDLLVQWAVVVRSFILISISTEYVKIQSMDNKVRTRFAPSPTGFIHMGSVYQVLFDWAYAKKHNGTFIIRIEDTDQKRKVEGAEENLYEGMKWLGLSSDEGPLQGGNMGHIGSLKDWIYTKNMVKNWSMRGMHIAVFVLQKD